VRVFEKIPTQTPTHSAYFQNLKEQLPGSVGERTDSYRSGYLTFVWGKKLENHSCIEERMLWYPRVTNLIPGEHFPALAEFSFFLSFFFSFLLSFLPSALHPHIRKRKRKRRNQQKRVPATLQRKVGRTVPRRRRRRSAKPIPSHHDLEWSCLELHLRFSIASQFV
jgi:hypothetical protein